MNHLSVADLYNILENLTSRIGNNCKVSVSMGRWGVLEFQVDWFDDDLHIRLIRCVDAHELRYMGDLTFFTDWFVFMAIREYKIKTVGEE